MCQQELKGKRNDEKKEEFLHKHTLEDPDGGGEVVQATGSLESGRDDGRGRDEIVGEGVVEVALWKKSDNRLDIVRRRSGRQRLT